MREINEKIVFKCIGLAIPSLLVLIKLYLTFYKDDIIDGLLIFGGVLVFIPLYIYVLYHDKKMFRNFSKKICFIPSILGTLFIITTFSIIQYQNNIRNEKSYIHVVDNASFGPVSIDLKVNGNFIITSSSMVGANYYYGKYSIKDSIVNFVFNDKPFSLGSNKYVIKSVPKKEAIQKNMTYMHPIGKDGKIIESIYDFRLVENNNN